MRISTLVQGISWISFFVCAWLIILRKAPSDLMAGAGMLFFVIVAILGYGGSHPIMKGDK